jgi:hypothetical protein
LRPQIRAAPPALAFRTLAVLSRENEFASFFRVFKRGFEVWAEEREQRNDAVRLAVGDGTALVRDPLDQPALVALGVGFVQHRVHAPGLVLEPPLPPADGAKGAEQDGADGRPRMPGVQE